MRRWTIVEGVELRGWTSLVEFMAAELRIRRAVRQFGKEGLA